MQHATVRGLPPLTPPKWEVCVSRTSFIFGKGNIVITERDLNGNDRERLNSGVQSVLVKEMFRPAELVERIRRLVHTNPAADSKMEAAS